MIANTTILSLMSPFFLSQSDKSVRTAHSELDPGRSLSQGGNLFSRDCRSYRIALNLKVVCVHPCARENRKE